MARRAGKAAAAWMIHRQQKINGYIDPDNPHDLPVVVITGTAAFYGVAAALSFSLVMG